MIPDPSRGTFPFGLEVGRRYVAADLARLPFCGDLPKVAEWLRSPLGSLSFLFDPVPLSAWPGLAGAAADLPGFPADLARVARIEARLRSGSDPWPLFVEEHDPELFVMEGRHRRLAFFSLGMTEAPAMRVSVV